MSVHGNVFSGEKRAGNFLNIYATMSLSARTMHNVVISLDVLESTACPLQLTCFKVFDRRHMRHDRYIVLIWCTCCKKNIKTFHNAKNGKKLGLHSCDGFEHTELHSFYQRC